jgi:hypothetical protein
MWAIGPSTIAMMQQQQQQQQQGWSELDATQSSAERRTKEWRSQ